MLLTGFLGLLFHTVYAHLPRSGTTRSKQGPPTPIDPIGSSTDQSEVDDSSIELHLPDFSLS